ncbi:hypothetical protein GGI15_002794 [Coemansia interrupta]|uniref:Uncharacterized protein n=1 Tax=Coemansia interrupta TaxID=1126814 RepID=A0A9W8LJQ6_9FUNG|nr:hypothetical protein GGI15_002794 [Coemansia interrupta]
MGSVDVLLTQDGSSVWEADDGARRQVSTVPRNFHQSTLVRRRLDELGRLQVGGPSDASQQRQQQQQPRHPGRVTWAAPGLLGNMRMSMPVDIEELISITAAQDGMTMGSEDSMLQMLLSKLPEPPATAPGMGSLNELADSLPPPPVSPPVSPRRTELPTSPFSQSFAPRIAEGPRISQLTQIWPVPTETEVEKTETEVETVMLETPAPSRRNTDEVAEQKQQRLQDSCSRLSDRGDDVPVFRVDVYAMLSSGSLAGDGPRVVVSELDGATGQARELTVEEVRGSSAVQTALAGCPAWVAEAAAKAGADAAGTGAGATLMRMPSARQQIRRRWERPTVSFCVGGGQRQRQWHRTADRRIRTVDVEAMAATHVRRQKSGSCAASESSAQTLSSQQSDGGSLRSVSSDDTVAEARVSVLAKIDENKVSGIRMSQIKAPLITGRSRLQQPSLLPSPVGRRRSEIEALLTQADAVLNNGVQLRRSATLESQRPQLRGSTSSLGPPAAPRSRLPRASFPLALGRPPSMLPLLSGGPPSRIRSPTPLAPSPARQPQPQRPDDIRGSVHASTLRQPSLRHVGSVAALRRPGADGRTLSTQNSSGSVRRHTTAERAAAGGMRRAAVRGVFNGAACGGVDEEFLTLRPVHTPDIVPRTFDPRLVERAMTPMLKTNAGILHSSIADMLRASDAAQQAEHVSPLASPLGSPVLSPATSPAMSPVMSSVLSPIGSPQPAEPRRSFSGRFSRPGFLSRNSHSSSGSGGSVGKSKDERSFASMLPLPPLRSAKSARAAQHTPSAIPMPPKQQPPPPPPAPAAPQAKSGLSAMRKARSLWTLRSSLAK